MKRKTCLTLALALTLSIPNCVSAASGETVYSVSAEAQATEGKAEAGGEAAQGSEVAELFGKPWIDSVVTGNLPRKRRKQKTTCTCTTIMMNWLHIRASITFRYWQP